MRSKTKCLREAGSSPLSKTHQCLSEFSVAVTEYWKLVTFIFFFKKCVFYLLLKIFNCPGLGSESPRLGGPVCSVSGGSRERPHSTRTALVPSESSVLINLTTSHQTPLLESSTTSPTATLGPKLSACKP